MCKYFSPAVMSIRFVGECEGKAEHIAKLKASVTIYKACTSEKFTLNPYKTKCNFTKSITYLSINFYTLELIFTNINNRMCRVIYQVN